MSDFQSCGGVKLHTLIIAKVIAKERLFILGRSAPRTLSGGYLFQSEPEKLITFRYDRLMQRNRVWGLQPKESTL
jgi:hypothetical protein